MNEQIIPLFTRSTLIFTLKKKTKKQIKVLKDDFYVSKEKRIIKKKKQINDCWLRIDIF